MDHVYIAGRFLAICVMAQLVPENFDHLVIFDTLERGGRKAEVAGRAVKRRATLRSKLLRPSIPSGRLHLTKSLFL